MHERIKSIRQKHHDGIRFFADMKEKVFLVEANAILPDEFMDKNFNTLNFR
jgi:hypothetical protein